MYGMQINGKRGTEQVRPRDISIHVLWGDDTPTWRHAPPEQHFAPGPCIVLGDANWPNGTH